jgi:hypothetical protein
MIVNVSLDVVINGWDDMGDAKFLSIGDGSN